MKNIIATLAVAAGSFAMLVGGASAADKSSNYIAREVGHELRSLPYYGVFDSLSFEVKGDEVKLMGAVTRPTTKTAAEEAIRGIEGVGNVDNEIEVLPVSDRDDRIRLDAFQVIYGHPALNRYVLKSDMPIHILVKNGEVTLVGAVGNEMDKRVAGIQVNGVQGVHKVTNQLQVSGD